MGQIKSSECSSNELVIGEKTNISYAVPFHSTWMDDGTGNSISDFVYCKEELVKFGLKPGNKVTAITFRGIPVVDKEIKSLTVEAWLGTMDDPSTFVVGDVNKDDMTLFTIFNEEVVTFTKDEEVEFKLDLSKKPFIWDGKSAIRIYTNINGHGQSLNISFPVDKDYSAYSSHGTSGPWTSADSPVACFSLAFTEKLAYEHVASDKAVGYPNNGNPVAQAYQQDSSQETKNSENLAPNGAYIYVKEPSSTKWLYAIIGVLAAALIGLGFWMWQSSSSDNTEKQVEQIVDNTPVKSETISKSNESHQFKGSIGKYGVEMMITIDGDEIEGLLHYNSQKKGTNLLLKGIISENGKMTIGEYDPSGENTGRFEGNFDGTTLKGTFVSFSSGKKLPFELSKVSSLSSLSEEDKVVWMDEGKGLESDEYEAVEDIYDSAESSDESIIEAKMFINNSIIAENQMCPIDYNNGTVYESASYNYGDNVIQYNYAVAQLDNFNEDVKEGVLYTFKGTYVANPRSRLFFDAVIKAKTKMLLNYYTIEGESRKIVIMPTELESYIHN